MIKKFYPSFLIIAIVIPVYFLNLKSEVMAVHPKIADETLAINNSLAPICKGITNSCNVANSDGWIIKVALNGLYTSLPFLSEDNKKYFGKRMIFVQKKNTDIQYIFEEFMWNTKNIKDISEFIRFDSSNRKIVINKLSSKEKDKSFAIEID